MRRVALRLLPGALVILAGTLLLVVPRLRDWTPTLVPTLPFVVLAAGFLLGWRFRSPRAVLAVTVLALADLALVRWVAGVEAATPGGRAVLGAVALFLPLDLALLAWLSERRARPWLARLLLGLIALEAVGVVLISGPATTRGAALLQHAFAGPLVVAWPAIPPLAVLAFLAALATTTMRFALAPRPMEAALLWALVASVLALGDGRAGLTATIYLATAGLALVVGLVETSYALAFQDELTGLPTRRAMNVALQRLGAQYAVAMVDIDHFKKFNDDYGHAVGDQLLRMVAAALGRIGGGGRAYRWGGEEFAILFPEMTTTEARPHCEGVRQAIAASGFMVRGRGRPRRKPKNPRSQSPGRKRAAVTVSIGLADAARGHPAPADVVRAADQALYRAKQAGRNRIVV